MTKILFKNKFLPLLLCLIICFSVVGCKNAINDNVTQEIKISCVDAQTKILQQQEFNSTLSELYVFASIGEYEAGQILIQPKADVKFYDITLNDLSSSNGKILKKENITVYNQKYINCIIPSEGITLPTGYYPDALLPFQTAKDYGENCIKGGNNQTIYVEFHIPYSQEAGKYTGNFQLTVDEKTETIPVKVEVLNFEMSKDVHLKSYYNTRLHFSAMGELSGKLSTQQKYFDTLVDYRLTAPSFSANEGFDNFLAKAREYSSLERDVRLSTICLSLTEKGDSFNSEELSEQIKRFVQVSIEDGVNYPEKIIFRPGIFDEPFLTTSKIPKINRILPKFYQWRNDLAEEIENDSSFESGEMKNACVESIKKIPCLITTYFVDELRDSVKNYCVPTYKAFASAYSINEYQTFANSVDESQWVYSCGGQLPGYKIDTTVLNLRGMSWMCFEAGFEGTLNWEDTMYVSDDGSKINPYEDAMRSAGTNGDGYIFYPGRYYGLDEPVTSVRLHALRDGYEDYEWLYLLDNLYKAKGYSSNDILSTLFSRIYKNNIATDNVNAFNETRYALGKLVELAYDGVYITDAKEFIDKYVFTVHGDNDALKTVNSNTVENGQTEFTCPKTSSSNCLLTVESSKGTTLELFICGKVESYQDFGTQEFANKCSVDNGTVEFAEIEGEKTIKLSLNNAMFFNMPIDASINKQLSQMKIQVFSEIETDTYVNVYFTGSGGQTIVQDFYIKKGCNILTITDLPRAKWNLVKKIEQLKIEFPDKATGDIYLNDITVIKEA